ncbi:DUF6455 family protein [Thalassovita sp.]|uniref:DUF6455 family protein n=1 Tax=Thalassovita sp. TaxID=1979401 RepID=UPI0029DE7DAB|nr:DUF6455 family protein [Thalassovita sp.]
MSIFDKIDRHAGIMNKMADTVGVDWAAEVKKDPSLAYRYREAVMSCTHCQHDGECQGWMAEHPHATETPDYCRNKVLLEGLAED